MKRLTIHIGFVCGAGLGLLLALLCLLNSSYTEVPVAYAAEWHVCPRGCPYVSIQAAVDAASNGDVIKVAAGTYTGVSARAGETQVVYINKSISIWGGYTTTNWTTPYPITQPTTLNAQGQGRVLYIAGNIAPAIEGLHITGGNGSYKGGGVYISSATASIKHNWIYSNTALWGCGLYLEFSAATLSSNTIFSNANSTSIGGDAGGGLYLWQSAATLSENTITSNTVNFGDGGGLYLYNSAAIVRGNTIAANIATIDDYFGAGGKGGGLYLDHSDATITGNSIMSNRGFGGAGGLEIVFSDPMISGNSIMSNTGVGAGGLWLSGSGGTISGNSITSNSSFQEGGGLYLGNNDAKLSKNLIASNSASIGGGLYLVNDRSMLEDNIITGNRASDGGGLYLIDSNVTLANNLIADNQAKGGGSGLEISGSSARLLHTTIARNGGSDGSGVFITGVSPDNLSTVALTNTILVSQTVGITVTADNTATLEATLWGSGTWSNVTNWGGGGAILTGTVNISGDPKFVSPSSGNYHIGLASAAIDAGVPSGIIADIDGDPRPAAWGYDIGADERPGASLHVSKAASTPILNVGQSITYTLVVTSVGIDTTTNIRLTDTLPVLQQAVTITATKGNCTTGTGWGANATCSLATMAPGDRAYITITAQVTTVSPAQLPQVMHNAVWVTADETSNTAHADTMLHNCHVRLNNDPTEYAAIQAAVDTSTRPADVVKVAGYCISVTSRKGVTQTVYVSKTLTLQGGWNIAFTQRNVTDFPTTLDAQGGGRVLYITGKITPTMEGLHITGGSAAGLGGYPSGGYDVGGGVYVISAAATIRNNWIFSNTAGMGGGLFLHSSTATLRGNVITSNTSLYDGAGLESWSGAVMLSDNLVAGNTAGDGGGGLYVAGHGDTLNGNTIAFNTASWAGGLYLEGQGETLNRNTITYNTARNGGGVYLDDTDATLNGNTILSNTAYDEGGGLLLRGSATLKGNVIAGNGANFGGGLYLEHSNATLVNNFVADNRANSSGSGLAIRGSSPRLLHTTITRNGGGDGSSVYISNYPYDNFSNVALTNTILVSQTVGITATAGNTATLEATLWGGESWANGTNWGGKGTILTGTVNIFGDPGFVDPYSGDYHITLTSTAVNAGVNAEVLTDIDNQPRPYQAPDLGADEYWPPGTLKYIYLPLVYKNYSYLTADEIPWRR